MAQKPWQIQIIKKVWLISMCWLNNAGTQSSFADELVCDIYIQRTKWRKKYSTLYSTRIDQSFSSMHKKCNITGPAGSPVQYFTNSFHLIQICTACCNTNWLVPVGMSFNLFMSILFPFIQLLNVDHIIIFQWLNINSIVEQLITGFSLFSNRLCTNFNS